MQKTKFLLVSLVMLSGFAHAGVTPYTDQPMLPRILKAELTHLNWGSLTPLEQSEIQPLVKNMRKKAGTNSSLGNAIGLRSGMHLLKDGVWSPREVRNWQGLGALPVPAWDKTKNNITWYPDYQRIENGVNVISGIRFTTGKFNMGSMPLLGKAFLEIPLENIRRDGTKVWFKALVEPDYEEDGNDAGATYTTNLNPLKNYYQVLVIKAPILDFLGYYDTATGEWKIKFIIRSDIEIDPSQYDDEYDNNHPDLDLEVYSSGFAL